MNTPLRVEYTASALIRDDYRDRIESAVEFCQNIGWQFGIQIHNSTPTDRIDTLAGFGLPLSVHAPVMSTFFMNLANESDKYARDSLTRSVKMMRQFDATLAVYHGFLMTDRPIEIFNANRTYVECMEMALRDELTQPGLKLCADFMDTDEYKLRLDRVKQRIRTLEDEFPDLTFCIENDYPLYGSGLLLSDAVNYLEAPVCLDISHLWIAAMLFGRDFHEEIEAIAQAGRIECVHFHANPVLLDTPKDRYRDGHLPLSIENDMDLPRVAAILQNHNVNHWVIETPKATVSDLELLAAWLDKKAQPCAQV